MNWSAPQAGDLSGFEAHGLAEDLIVSKRDALTALDGAPIVDETCAGIHIQSPKYLGAHEVGRREASAVHHNVRNGAQMVRARIGNLHLEAWNFVAGDLALRDTDVGRLAALERSQSAMHCCPAFPSNLRSRRCEVYFLKETFLWAVNPTLLQKQQQSKKSIKTIRHSCHCGHMRR